MVGTGSGNSTSGSKPPPSDEIAERFELCQTFFDRAKWDDLKGCYAPGAVHEEPGSGMPAIRGPDAIVGDLEDLRGSFPDLDAKTELLLVNGRHVAAVTRVHGTNTRPSKTSSGDEAPPTNRAIGLSTAQLLEVDDQGRITKETSYVDRATMAGQLRPDPKHRVRPVMVSLPREDPAIGLAQNDANETSNLATAKRLVVAFNLHDEKALAALLADELLWSVEAMPADAGKTEALAEARQLWKACSDAKIDVAQQWAAFSFVVTAGSLTGTNDGDAPSLHLDRTGMQISVPFFELDFVVSDHVRQSWLFFQSAAR